MARRNVESKRTSDSMYNSFQKKRTVNPNESKSTSSYNKGTGQSPVKSAGRMLRHGRADAASGSAVATPYTTLLIRRRPSAGPSRYPSRWKWRHFFAPLTPTLSFEYFSLLFSSSLVYFFLVSEPSRKGGGAMIMQDHGVTDQTKRKHPPEIQQEEKKRPRERPILTTHSVVRFSSFIRNERRMGERNKYTRISQESKVRLVQLPHGPYPQYTSTAVVTISVLRPPTSREVKRKIFIWSRPSRPDSLSLYRVRVSFPTGGEKQLNRNRDIPLWYSKHTQTHTDPIVGSKNKCSPPWWWTH